MAGTTRGNCLIITFGEIEPAFEAEYTRWYDTRHIPQRLAVPGFLAAARYRLQPEQDGPQRYMTLYELADAATLQSPALLKLNDAQDDWDRSVQAQIKSDRPGFYERVFATGQPPAEHPPYLFAVRLTVAPAADAEFNQWYDTEHLPALSAVTGVRGGRRYRKMSKQGGQYLTLYEYDSPDIRRSDAWKKAAATPWTAKMQPALSDVHLDLGRLVFNARA